MKKHRPRPTDGAPNHPHGGPYAVLESLTRTPFLNGVLGAEIPLLPGQAIPWGVTQTTQPGGPQYGLPPGTKEYATYRRLALRLDNRVPSEVLVAGGVMAFDALTLRAGESYSIPGAPCRGSGCCWAGNSHLGETQLAVPTGYPVGRTEVLQAVARAPKNPAGLAARVRFGVLTPDGPDTTMLAHTGEVVSVRWGWHPSALFGEEGETLPPGWEGTIVAGLPHTARDGWCEAKSFYQLNAPIREQVAGLNAPVAATPLGFDFAALFAGLPAEELLAHPNP